jgi:3',5'-cyclic AMP phosphodiesterase CpdA
MPLTLPPFDRRRFLGAALAGVAAGFAQAADATDPHTWALLADPHIHADPKSVSRGSCMGDRLAAAVKEVLALPQRPAAALVNGDLALKVGFPADYRTFAAVVGPLRRAGMPLHLTLGNHDDRDTFRATLPDAKRPETPVADKYVGVVNAGRTRFILLDSLVIIDKPPGEYGPAQLAWLAKTLDAEPKAPTVVFGHHDPSGLTDEMAFIDVIAPRRQVKAYVFGHTHSWQVARHKSGIHLVNLPAVSYPFAKGEALGWALLTLKESGATVVLRAADGHKLDRQTHELAWRS